MSLNIGILLLPLFIIDFAFADLLIGASLMSVVYEISHVLQILIQMHSELHCTFV